MNKKAALRLLLASVVVAIMSYQFGRLLYATAPEIPPDIIAMNIPISCGLDYPTFQPGQIFFRCDGDAVYHNLVLRPSVLFGESRELSELMRSRWILRADDYGNTREIRQIQREVCSSAWRIVGCYSKWEDAPKQDN